MSNIQEIAACPCPTDYGTFDLTCYFRGGNLAFALAHGDVDRDGVLVRVQSACMLSEAFFVNCCDCGDQLRRSLELGGQEESFLLVYLPDQEGRGLGMFQKIQALALELREGIDTLEAFRRLDLPLELREWGFAADVIRRRLGERTVRLMTNNPVKQEGLEERGIQVTERVPLVVEASTPECRRYLEVKRAHMGHHLPRPCGAEV